VRRFILSRIFEPRGGCEQKCGGFVCRGTWVGYERKSKVRWAA
jgi:hypothetical protein